MIDIDELLRALDSIPINFKAGELGGAWVAAKLGADAANAKIAMLDLNESQPSVGVLRDQGFLSGFGIDVKDVSRWGDETDERIICNEVTNGNEEGTRTHHTIIHLNL